MRRRVVHAAISLYPPGWRRRYGAELEQLVLDVAGAGSPLEDIRTVAGLAAAGIKEWVRRVGRRTRTALFTLAAGCVALLINAVATGVDRESLAVAATWMKLSPTVVLGSGVEVRRSSGPFGSDSGSGTGSESRHGEILITIRPTSGHLISVSGGPVHVVLDPKTGVLESVSRIHSG